MTEEKKKWYKNWKIVVPLIVLVLIIMANALGKKEHDNNKTGKAAQSTSIAAKTQKKAYVSDPKGRQSISIEQIFEDTVNWSGRRLITGFITKLHVPKDAMGQGNEVTYIDIGYNNKTLQIVLEKPIREGVLKINDQITVEADINLISKSFGNGRGDIYDGPVNVAAWDASMKKDIPSVISVDDYFSKNMKLGSQPITIVGPVASKNVDHNEVWIILGASGGKVHGELSRIKINETVKKQYESIQIGSRVAFKGSFNTEMGNVAYFTIEEIVLNPSY